MLLYLLVYSLESLGREIELRKTSMMVCVFNVVANC